MLTWSPVELPLCFMLSLFIDGQEEVDGCRLSEVCLNLDNIACYSKISPVDERLLLRPIIQDTLAPSRGVYLIKII